jgi:AcrR family transcriptional regulator
MTDVKTAPAKRLSRGQSRAETRRRLIDAAAEVFAERGFHGASVEEIAERAGYTRGAFYSNFSGKDDAFLSVYDERMDVQIQEIGDLMRASSDPADFLTTLRGRRRDAPTTFAWMLLEHEFRLYALRNPEIRPKFAERHRRVRREYVRAIEGVFRSLGVALPAPVEDMAVILHVLDEGTLPLHYLDPETVRQGFFFDALTLLFESAVALSRQQQAG